MIFCPYFQPAMICKSQALVCASVCATVGGSLEEFFQHQDLPALQAVFGVNYSARRMDGTTPTAK